MIKQFIRDRLQNVFELLGIQVERIKHLSPIDLRNTNNDPLSLHYLTECKRQVLITASMANGRGLDIHSLNTHDKHPFVFALLRSESDGYREETIRRALDNYYTSIQPKNTADWLGLTATSKLKQIPAWVGVLPWEKTTPSDKEVHKRTCAIHDNNEHGLDAGIEKGWRNFGPVAPEILQLESKRLHNLALSIKRHGYNRSSKMDDDIGAIILKNNDGNWRWIVENGGQHRAAVLSALGYKNLTLRVWGIVDVNDAKAWPQVTAGVYSAEEAIQTFYNIYNAESPLIHHWKKNCNSKF